MKAVLIDSDVLIEVARGRNQAVLARWEELSRVDTIPLCSPVTIAEVWHGARPHENATLTQLFAALLCVPIDAAIGRRTGDYLREYHRTHHVELGDALIAATATLHNLGLWTRNRKHYPMKDLVFY